MNERIKQFAAQAYSYASEQTGEFTPEFMGFYDEKFAELIVLECAEVAFKHWEQHKGCSAHFSIREHFGVEG
jgi:hypothetical protein